MDTLRRIPVWIYVLSAIALIVVAGMLYGVYQASQSAEEPEPTQAPVATATAQVPNQPEASASVSTPSPGSTSSAEASQDLQQYQPNDTPASTEPADQSVPDIPVDEAGSLSEVTSEDEPAVEAAEKFVAVYGTADWQDDSMGEWTDEAAKLSTPDFGKKLTEQETADRANWQSMKESEGRWFNELGDPQMISAASDGKARVLMPYTKKVESQETEEPVELLHREVYVNLVSRDGTWLVDGMGDFGASDTR